MFFFVVVVVVSSFVFRGKGSSKKVVGNDFICSAAGARTAAFCLFFITLYKTLTIYCG